MILAGEREKGVLMNKGFKKLFERFDMMDCAIIIASVIMGITTLKCCLTSATPVEAVSPEVHAATETEPTFEPAMFTTYNVVGVAKKVSDASPYNGEFNSDMDLLNRMDITEDDMNKIIDYYLSHCENNESIFNGKGGVFCQASNSNGLDPIFILMATALRYGWGYNRNDVVLTSDNTDVNKQFAADVESIANCFYDGYYSNGYHSISEIVESNKNTDLSKWAETITSMMDKAYKIIIE